MMAFRAFLIGLLLTWALPAAADKPVAPADIPGVTTVSAEKTVELITVLPLLIVVDSRRKEEFEKGHIEGAFNLLDTEMTLAGLTKIAPRRDTPLLFYCNGERCLRSAHAAKLALGWGYGKVFWFRGGWMEWGEKNLPVAR